MAVEEVAVDAMLAAALRGETADAPGAALRGDPASVLARITYHGLAGLLHERPASMTRWPDAMVTRVRAEALGQAMWELRHRQILADLLAKLAAEKVVAVLLKGTALAYDLYSSAAARARGDSDLLVGPGDLAAARQVLDRLGFACVDGSGASNDPYRLQEVWSRTCERGMVHHVDLHWHVLNCPALDDVLPVTECVAHRIALPRLAPFAMAMDRVRSLIHACIHRRLNFSSPYFVGDRVYFSGDRLVWLTDIDLIARALSDEQWRDFTRLAAAKGVAAACLDGLLAAQRALGTPIAPAVRDALVAASTPSRAAAYLQARQFGRAWRDLRSMPGVRRKYGYLLARTLPSAQFMRDKYPRQAGLPLPLLYARRMVDLIRSRPRQGGER